MMNEGFDIGQAFEDAVTQVFEYLPVLFGALVLLLVGYLVAKIAGAAVYKALRRFRFDHALHNSAAGKYIARLVDSPSRFVSRITFWLLFLLFVTMAVSALQLPLLDEIVQGIYNYVPRIIAAIIIFLIASAISAGTAGFVQRVMGRTPTAKMITAVVPAVVLSIAAFMILNQLGIAEDIVNILFTAIVGSIALGMALAFGLGGRDVAHDLLEQAYEKGKQQRGQAKADIQQARNNTKQEVERAKRRAQQAAR